MIYFVNPATGVDTGLGDELAPWRTVKKATDTAQPGDEVRLRGGVYLPNDGNAGLRTKRSGRQGAYITFRAHENELPVFKHQYLGIAIEHSFLRFLGLGVINDTNGLMESGICHWENHGPIDHVVVDGCTVRNVMPNDPRHGIRLENLSYGIIRRNTVDHIGTAPQPGPEGGNGLWITGHYNLIEENQTDFCGHAGIFAMGNRIIVRKNNCNGTWGVPAEYLCFGRTDYLSLVEDNILRNASYLQDGLWRNPAWEQMGSGTIFRRNLMYNSIGAGMQFYSRSDYQTKYIRACHNVLYNCGGVPPPAYIECPYQLNEDVANTMNDIIIKNNINYANKNANRAAYAGYATAADIAFVASLWNDINPLFKNAPDDFSLLYGSPAINAGDFLTVTRAAGSGQSMPVADARWFCDGWGIVDGDWIQLESTTEAVQVASIDIANNVLNLKEPLSWWAGQGVSLPFVSSKPDIGAFEYIGGYMPTASINIILEILGIPGITLAATPTSRSIQRGQSTTYQIAVGAVDGYAGSVSFAATGLPTGVTATFAPAAVTPGQSTTLTVTTPISATPGSYTVVVTATGA